MARILERVTSALLTIAALLIAASLVHRELSNTRQEPQPRPLASVDYVPNWQKLASAGRVVGDAAAPIMIVEFMDLECPFCRRLNSTIRGLAPKQRADVAYSFVHMPLPNHKFAMVAARVVECAAEVGHFEQMVNAIYGKQDSLGLKDWTSFAQDAGISDTVGLAKCARQSSTVPKVDAGIAAARSINVHGTPTVIVNGWRFSKPPTEAELTRAFEAIRAGKAVDSVLRVSGA